MLMSMCTYKGVGPVLWRRLSPLVCLQLQPMKKKWINRQSGSCQVFFLIFGGLRPNLWDDQNVQYQWYSSTWDEKKNPPAFVPWSKRSVAAFAIQLKKSYLGIKISYGLIFCSTCSMTVIFFVERRLYNYPALDFKTTRAKSCWRINPTMIVLQRIRLLVLDEALWIRN
jgi:hypothetical protein